MWFPKTAFALSLFASLFLSANLMRGCESKRSPRTDLWWGNIRWVKKFNSVKCEGQEYPSIRLNIQAEEACTQIMLGNFYIQPESSSTIVPLDERLSNTAIMLERYKGIQFIPRSLYQELYLTKMYRGDDIDGKIHRVVFGWDPEKRICETKGAVAKYERWGYKRCSNLVQKEREKQEEAEAKSWGKQ